MPTVYCQNCDWHGDDAKCLPVVRVFERVLPGEVMPYGECPECGAVCHDAEAGAKTAGVELLEALKDAVREISALQEYGHREFGDEWWQMSDKKFARDVVDLVTKDSYDDVIARAETKGETL